MAALIIAFSALTAAAAPTIIRFDASDLASLDTRSNRFEEGVTIDSFGSISEGYSWRRAITELGSNGFFRADYSVSGTAWKPPLPHPDLSVLFFRPDSPPGRASSNILDLAHEFELQKGKVHQARTYLRRPHQQLQALEHALSGALLRSNSLDQFLGEPWGFSFVGTLPSWFPGIDSATAHQPRRITVRLRSINANRDDLYLEHSRPGPPSNALPAVKFVLAKNAGFIVRYFDPASGGWTNAWTASNSLPPIIDATLITLRWVKVDLDQYYDYPPYDDDTWWLVGDWGLHSIVLPASAPASITNGFAVSPLTPPVPGPIPSTALQGAEAPARETVLAAKTPPVPVAKLPAFRWSDTILQWMGFSGVELARYTLVTGAAEYDALNQPWAGGTGAGIPALPLHQFPLNGGTLSVDLVDLGTNAPVPGLPININTASPGTLQALPSVDASLAAAIVATRAGPDGIDGNDDDRPYRSISDLGSVPGMTAQIAQAIAPQCTVRSSCFQATITATLGRERRTYVATLWRPATTEVVLLKLVNMD